MKSVLSTLVWENPCNDHRARFIRVATINRIWGGRYPREVNYGDWSRPLHVPRLEWNW